MSEPKHTPGRIYAEQPHGDLRVTDTGDFLALAPGGGTREQRVANAERLAACWNACEGINPEAVPELLAALSGALEALAFANGFLKGDARIVTDAKEQVRAAIAKAKGEK